MKKWMMFALTALMLLTVTACGGNSDGDSSGDAGNADVDLESCYAGLAEEYHWTEDAENSQEGDLLMTSIADDLLESYYAGLSEVPHKQLVVKAPMMSSLVNEIALIQCDTEEDADKAAEIFQARIDYQVGDETNPGGAWYPESIEAWKQAQVIREGTYVAMIASAEHQSEIAEQFQSQFQ